MTNLITIPADVVINTHQHIRAIRDYLDLAQAAVEAKARESQDHVQHGHSASQDDYQDAWHQHQFSFENAYIADSQQYSAMEQHLTYSLVPLTYMVFESQTIATCREARVVHKLQHDVLDVKKPGAAAKAREYLLKNLGIDIGDKQRYSEWDHLMNLRRLRNCIVHEAGRVRGDEIVKAFGSLQLTYAGLLSSVRDYFSDVPILLVREPLCRRFLDSVETFFPRLFSDCGIRTQPPVAPAAQPSQ